MTARDDPIAVAWSHDDVDTLADLAKTYRTERDTLRRLADERTTVPDNEPTDDHCCTLPICRKARPTAPVAHPDNRWTVDGDGWLCENGLALVQFGKGNQSRVLAALNGPTTTTAEPTDNLALARWLVHNAGWTWSDAERLLPDIDAAVRALLGQTDKGTS